MALSDKNIIITPNTSQTADPKIDFKGASASLGAQTITLNVYSTSNGTLSFEGSAGQLFSITNDLTGTIFSVNDVSGIPSIEVNADGTVSIARYGGNVGVGTGSPGQKFEVSGNARVTSLGVGTNASGTTGEIRATNEITAYYSDRRLKENVETIDNAVAKVLSLNGITYNPNALAESFGYDRSVSQVGLFADEVEAVLPQAVKPAPFDSGENGSSKSGENYKTIQYEKLAPLLIEAIKEQQKTIDFLMQHLGLKQ